MNRTIKDSLLNSVGSHFRLDDVLLLVFYKVNGYFETRLREKRRAVLSSSKRMNYYEDRAKKARSIVEEAMTAGSERIRIVCKTRGIALVKGDAGPRLLALTAARKDVPCYEVDLSSVSCTCGDLSAIACKHILATAIVLPDAARRYEIGMLSSRQPSFDDQSQGFDDFVRDSLASLPALSSEDPGVDAEVGAAADAAADAAAAAEDVEPFLVDGEGAFLHASCCERGLGLTLEP
jgi:hypothetical protein